MVRNREELKYFFNAGLKFIILIGIPVTVLLLVLAQSAVLLVYGATFMPAAAPLRILALSVPFWFCNVAFYHLIVATGQQRHSLMVFGVMLVLTIFLNLWAIPLWGAVGAAIATVLTEAAGLLLWIRVSRTWIQGSTGWFLLKLVAMHAPLGGLRWLMADVHPILQALAYVVGLTLLFFVTGCHHDKDMGPFLRSMRQRQG